MAPHRKISRSIRVRAENSAKLAKAHARVQRWLQVLDDLLDGYEKDHPHWRGLALLWLIEGALQSLRVQLEAGKQRRARWSRPFIELRYAVNWNWKQKDPDDPFITYGQLSSKAPDTVLKKQVCAIAVETVIQTALQEFTNRAAMEIYRGQYLPLLPIEVIDVLRKIRSRRRRQEVMDELYRPFSMGAAEVGFDEESLKEGAPLSVKVQRELTAATQRMDLPPITMTITKDDHVLKLTPVFLIHPLVVDRAKKQAYYPLTVGISLIPEVPPGEDPLTLLDAPWIQPDRWPASERRTLWNRLIGAFRDAAENLKVDNAPAVEDAVLTVSAKIRVKVNPSDPDGANSAVTQRLHKFSETGAVIEMNHAWAHASDSQPGFAELLQHVET